MIQEGAFLKFVPPLLCGGSVGNEKARYMLVIENNKKEKIIKMLNVSSLKNKEHKLLFDSNKEIDNYKPLVVQSFVKLDTTYIIDYFDDLNNYVAFAGGKLEDSQFGKIKKYRYEYMLNKKISVIEYTEEEFRKYNKKSC